MGIIIGIDVGISTTKIVGLRQGDRTMRKWEHPLDFFHLGNGVFYLWNGICYFGCFVNNRDRSLGALAITARNETAGQP